MRKTVVAIMAVLALAMLVNVPYASAWYFELTRPGPAMNDTFELWFRVDPSESVTMTDYKVDFGYDPVEMTYLGYDHKDPFKPGEAGTLEDKGEYPPGSGQNVLDKLTALSVGGWNINTDTLVATMTYTLDAPVVDGLDDMYFYSMGASYGATVDEVYQPQTNTTYFVNGPGLDVPVPIPSAVLLFGSGLLGLIGIGRKKLIS